METPAAVVEAAVELVTDWHDQGGASAREGPR